jgi:hypothetical protein
MMVVVAVAAAPMAASVGYSRLRHISADYRGRAERHAGMEQTLRWIVVTGGANAPVDVSRGPGLRSRRFFAGAVAEHEGSLRRKYERAARYPRLPLEPDPPEP